MNYIAPASREQYELYKDKWSSEQLDAFWSDFLKTHKLQANDRFNHDLPRLSLPLEAPTPPTPSKRPSSPSPVPDVRPVHAARGPSNKRPRQGSPTPSDTDTKRAHITRITRSQAGPSEGPRRSKRIREHEERVAVAQMPAPVAVPRGRGRRGAAAKHQASTSRSSGRGGAAGTPSRGGARTRGGSRSRSRSDRDARTTTSRK
ncbi:hypothetical protein L227DRAFT_343680 [Lentinus tigrinus ALCF2SS1-6]|uniref:Uncharacterized protein n=1 Tax=Lentinus tigrinus ALCF2SS1-6 TaxID=1328759 RepID=A0A5C2RWE3_9APHY|nr:hypothetical protein L227DRAFT_343680 [Lentinus tigrinus ALCF2SS1-6]